MSTKSLPKKGGGGLEFQGLAAPSVFMCLPNVYQGNFLGVISGIFPLISPFFITNFSCVRSVVQA